MEYMDTPYSPALERFGEITTAWILEISGYY